MHVHPCVAFTSSLKHAFFSHEAAILAVSNFVGRHCRDDSEVVSPSLSSQLRGFVPIDALSTKDRTN